ncbi:hypothetical protein BJN34_0125 [Cupriavidus necator]|uniref:Uncharacterized protein n=1 Tax=Cupriavidus necator TaxID=106590 RepID=A0A2P1DUZ7_CUPNE|nr:hypothetical protein BJN34_0125 [Cupriavidus necator]
MSGLIDWELRCNLRGKACHRSCTTAASCARGHHRPTRRALRHAGQPARLPSSGRTTGRGRRD